MKPLLTPALWLAAIVVLVQSGLLTATVTTINFTFYAALAAGLLIAWKFNSSRIFFALLVLFFCHRALSYFSAGHTMTSASAHAALAAVGVLLPVNFVLLSLQREKGFIFSRFAPLALTLFVESVFVAVLCRPDSLVPGAGASYHAVIAAPLPFATLMAFAAAAVVLLIRFLLARKPAEGGLLWALAASLLALRFGGAGRIPSAYFATSAFMLAASIVETSYLLAYHDELTSLPSRRAFHEALLRLEPPYSIAMVDIDHFKRCNDNYGHDTGDQVLRLVASRLACVTGGGHAYRCGGEEFAILFPGKATAEVLGDLEQLRARIEASSFRLRGQERRQEARGPDRRTRRASAGQTIRQLSRAPAKAEISVTASIGVATSSSPGSSTEEVIKAADKALYRAKADGRNRVETADTTRRRARGKTAITA